MASDWWFYAQGAGAFHIDARVAGTTATTTTSTAATCRSCAARHQPNTTYCPAANEPRECPIQNATRNTMAGSPGQGH